MFGLDIQSINYNQYILVIIPNVVIILTINIALCYYNNHTNINYSKIYNLFLFISWGLDDKNVKMVLGIILINLYLFFIQYTCINIVDSYLKNYLK